MCTDRLCDTPVYYPRFNMRDIMCVSEYYDMIKMCSTVFTQFHRNYC